MLKVSKQGETRSFVQRKRGSEIVYLCVSLVLLLLAIVSILVAFAAPEETVRLALGGAGVIFFVILLVVVIDHASGVYRYHKMLRTDKFY